MADEQYEKRPKPQWNDEPLPPKPRRRRKARNVEEARELLEDMAEQQVIDRDYSDDLFLKLTPTQRKVLAVYAQTGQITKAHEVVGCGDLFHWISMRRSKAYRKAYAVARRVAGDIYESEAARRALTGVKRYKFFKGDAILHPDTGEPYYEMEYSDKLLSDLLAAFKPDVYRQRRDVTVRMSDEVPAGVGFAEFLLERVNVVEEPAVLPAIPVITQADDVVEDPPADHDDSSDGGNGKHHGGNGNGRHSGGNGKH